MGNNASKSLLNWVAPASLVCGTAAALFMESNASKIFALCGITSGMLLAHYLRSRELPALPSGWRSVELSEPESSMVMTLVPSISSVTFYEGPAEAAERHLRKRVGEIVALNPWLLGRLVRRGASRVHLFFDPAGRSTNAVFSTATSSLALSPTLPYESLVSAFQPYCVPAGKACIDAPEGQAPLLLRVTLVREAEATRDSLQQERFAVCVSLCHVVADGHTFYALYGMLSSGAGGSPAPLIVDRPSTLMEDVATVMGGHDCQDWLVSPGAYARSESAAGGGPAVVG